MKTKGKDLVLINHNSLSIQGGEVRARKADTKWEVSWTVKFWQEGQDPSATAEMFKGNWGLRLAAAQLEIKSPHA